MNALQQVLGLDEETGAYSKPFMLKRLTHAALCADRKISGAEIGRRVGVSKEQIRLYFLGGTARRGAQALEERVERAIEQISREREFTVPRVIGTPDEDYLRHEVVIRDLMAAPPHGGRKGTSAPDRNDGGRF